MPVGTSGGAGKSMRGPRRGTGIEILRKWTIERRDRSRELREEDRAGLDGEQIQADAGRERSRNEALTCVRTEL